MQRTHVSRSAVRSEVLSARKVLAGERRLRPSTIAGSVSPKRKAEYRAQLDPAYVAELRRRVEALGFRAVARAAGMSNTSLWRVLADGDQPPTVDAANRIRRALAELEPGASELPPPVASVRGTAHHVWIAMGAAFDQRDHDVFSAAMTAAPKTARTELLDALGRIAKSTAGRLSRPRRK